ncbi:hypothetical protein TMM008_24150 [Pseudomonas sp. 008]|nr:hypothetical protein TMM008_24150 [Pseudomonas sp. 008]
MPLASVARMEREMENLQHDYKQVEDTLGEAVLVLDFWRLRPRCRDVTDSA